MLCYGSVAFLKVELILHLYIITENKIIYVLYSMVIFKQGEVC